ncbi:MAG: hypothetical protein Q7R39_11845 [Dehalococcoidia bacterium]|nr:hypothetical protein [Dehalococcoidia bacterium]
MGAARTSALCTVADRLLAVAPPVLTVLAGKLSVDDLHYFIKLIREYLPDREREILAEMGPGAQMAAFADHFGDSYFPLHDYLRMGDAEEYTELLNFIPVVLQSVDYDDYDEMPDQRHGLQLMSFIVADPHDGPRVALGESCLKFVPLQSLIRVPDAGLSPEALHQALDNGPYVTLATWADMLFQKTGNFFLDADDEDLNYGGWPDWEPDVVKTLTGDWKQAELSWQRVTAMAKAVEEGPEPWLNKVLDYLQEKGAMHELSTVGQAEGAPLGAAGFAAGAAGPPPGQARLF